MMTTEELIANREVFTESLRSDLSLPFVSSKLDLSEYTFFFDIDNCLYDISTGISDLMGKKIATYGEYIGIPKDEVSELTFGYYQKYGLAIRGLILHHDIDPNHYDENVDQALPLESLLRPNFKLRNMLKNIKMKKWAFTNANKVHAIRVLKFLGIEDMFDGLTYCDYSEPNFSCKPELGAYEKAMREANVKYPSFCLFADDSVKNLETARKLGWFTIHVLGSDKELPSQTSHLTVQTITDLPNLLPELFDN